MCGNRSELSTEGFCRFPPKWGGLSSENLHTALNGSLNSGVLELVEMNFQDNGFLSDFTIGPVWKCANTPPQIFSAKNAMLCQTTEAEICTHFFMAVCFWSELEELDSQGMGFPIHHWPCIGTYKHSTPDSFVMTKCCAG